MSYTVLAWDRPIPVSTDDARAIVSRLQGDQAATRRPGVDALMQRLWQLYPHDIKGSVEDMVWEDTFPHEPGLRQPLQAFWISSPRAAEVVPVLVREANRLGFVVFDPDLDMTYLPSGSVLGASGSGAAVARQDPGVLEPRAAQDRLMGLLAAGLAPLGFKQESLTASRTVFVRRFDGGRQLIEPSLRVNANRLLFDCSFHAFLDAADKLLPPAPAGDPLRNAVYMFFLIKYMEVHMLVRLSRTETSEGKLAAVGPVGIPGLAETILKLVEHDMLPVLDRYRSFEAYGVGVAARLEQETGRPAGENTILRIAAVEAGAPGEFEIVAAHELARLDAEVHAATRRFADRPQMIANVAEVRDRVAQFIYAARARLSGTPR